MMDVRDVGRRQVPASPCLIEIAGVAGAGKSTLSAALCCAEGRYQRGPFIRTRAPSHLVYVLRGLPRLLPVLVANAARPPRMSWPDVKLMAYITGWRDFLTRRYGSSDSAVVLDQGPIYALVRLKAQGRGVAASHPFQRWWNDMLAQWLRTLSVIVWLDAPDDVLRARIDARAKAHTVKGTAADVGQRFITRYRELFDDVLRTVELSDPPRVLRFDTADTPVEQLVTDVRAILESEPDPSCGP